MRSGVWFLARSYSVRFRFLSPAREGSGSARRFGAALVAFLALGFFLEDFPAVFFWFFEEFPELAGLGMGKLNSKVWPTARGGRGNRWWPFSGWTPSGCIPSYVGLPTNEMISVCSSQVDPRPCGADGVVWKNKRWGRRSPPVRGCYTLLLAALTLCRSIPAGAGELALRQCCASGRSVYPHLPLFQRPVYLPHAHHQPLAIPVTSYLGSLTNLPHVSAHFTLALVWAVSFAAVQPMAAAGSREAKNLGAGSTTTTVANSGAGSPFGGGRSLWSLASSGRVRADVRVMPRVALRLR